MGKAAQAKLAIAEILKTVGAFASDDYRRANLQWVEVTRLATGVRLVATSGHVLACVTVTDGAIAAPIASHMGVGDTAYVMADVAAIRLSVGAGPEWSATPGPTGGYPDWAKVVPERADEGCSVVDISPNYLALVGKTSAKIAKACGGRKDIGLRMQTCGRLDPLRFDAITTGCEMIFVVMPLRM